MSDFRNYKRVRFLREEEKQPAMGKDRCMNVRIRQLSESEIPTVREWLSDPLFRSEFLAFGRDSDSMVAKKLKGLVQGTNEANILLWN